MGKAFIPDAITVERFYWGTVTKGTRAQLIEANITHAAPFPGDAGAAKHTQHTTAPDGFAIQISKQTKFTFDVRRRYTEREQEASDEREADRKAAEEAKKELSAMIQSASDLRERTAQYARVFADGALEFAAGGLRGGYRFDNASMEQLREAIDDVVNVIALASVTLDRKKRDAEIMQLRSRGAKADSQLQAFMLTATEGALRVDH